jgi:hypothetical protein
VAGTNHSGSRPLISYKRACPFANDNPQVAVLSLPFSFARYGLLIAGRDLPNEATGQ